MPLLLKIWSIIKDLLGKGVEVFNVQRKLIMMGLGVIGLLIIGIMVLSWAVNYHPKIKVISSPESPELNDTLKPLSLPQEDFFLPDEPDFLPTVMLEREPRRSWTAEDARPFWKDLTNEDPEKWRKRIETVIDELLEGVP